MRKTVLLLCLLAGPPAAGAQVFLGAELGPDAFLRGEASAADTSGEDAFAWALGSEVSSTTLYAVFGSTTPEREMLRYLRGGIYRRELAALVLLSEKTSVPFKTLAEKLPSGGLRGLAREHKTDALALFREAGQLKEAADLRVPLFLPPPRVSTAAAAGAEPSPLYEHEQK